MRTPLVNSTKAYASPGARLPRELLIAMTQRTGTIYSSASAVLGRPSASRLLYMRSVTKLGIPRKI